MAEVQWRARIVDGTGTIAGAGSKFEAVHFIVEDAEKPIFGICFAPKPWRASPVDQKLR